MLPIFRSELAKLIKLRSNLAKDLTFVAAQYFEFPGNIVFKLPILEALPVPDGWQARGGSG